MNAIIGTAGHIDHGKTALVRALTGIDTDRLPEEQRRGISIELGFAWMDLGAGDRAGVVDVPGHERFVRQMLAGAQGFDLLVLVVAADDGVMPQTEEHFEICHLLRVNAAIFVITKADLVSEPRIAEVKEEIAILAVGTRFESAPIVVTSARTGIGIEELRARVLAALKVLQRKRDGGPFRMPIDRSFIVKGHGVVVTGTAAGGRVRVGTELLVVPRGVRARVRELQVHESAVDEAAAGQRVAINIAGVDREDVSRGDTIVEAATDAVTQRFDARVEVRPSARRPVQSHERVRVHLGTSEAPGRIIWLDRDEVEPRAAAYAQVVLREPGVAFAGDSFVLRDETAERTLGGGTVLLVHARRHRRVDCPAVAAALGAIERGTPGERLVAFLRMLPALGAPPEAVAEQLAMSSAEAVRLVESSPDAKVLGDVSGAWLVSRDRFESYVERLVQAVREHHESHPSRPGIELEQLRQAAGGGVDTRLFRSSVETLVGDGRLVRRGNHVALPEHRVSLAGEGEAQARQVVAAIRNGGVMPPTFGQLESDLRIAAARLAEIIAVLQERGEIVKIAADMAFDHGVLTSVEARLRKRLSETREIGAAEFRDLLGASRKYSIPLLDYFDRTGVTVRTGDLRHLRET